MGNWHSIFFNLFQLKTSSGPSRVIRIVLLIVTLCCVLFYIKKDIDKKLDMSVAKYEKDVALVKEKKNVVSAMLDTLSTEYRGVDKELGSLQKSVSSMKKKSFTHSTKPLDSSYLPDSLSLSFMTSYTDTLASFMKVFAEKVDERGNLFKDIPVIPPIALSKLFTQERGFGNYKDPFTGKLSLHNGVDFAAVIGTPVIATANGVVQKTEDHRFWGKRVIIKHKNSFKTYYAHLGTVSVASGKRVRKGEKIGTIGETGLVTGPRVHYEIHHNGKAVDPRDYLLLRESK